MQHAPAHARAAGPACSCMEACSVQHGTPTQVHAASRACTCSCIFFEGYRGAHPPPAGHTQTTGQSPTAGGRRQSLTDEGRLTHPISGGAQRLDQKKRGACSCMALLFHVADDPRTCLCRPAWIQLSCTTSYFCSSFGFGACCMYGSGCVEAFACSARPNHMPTLDELAILHEAAWKPFTVVRDLVLAAQAFSTAHFERHHQHVHYTSGRSMSMCYIIQPSRY
jgi:hypothetical protein